MKGSFSGAVDGGILNAFDFYCQKSQQVAQGCAHIQSGDKCETKCLFLVEPVWLR